MDCISVCNPLKYGVRARPARNFYKVRYSMNQKEVSELRRRWQPEKNAVSRIYGCFVNANREIISDLDESLGPMPQEEAERYLGQIGRAHV